jgi:TolB-like protein/Tfp pilus assembly protein PilF
MSPEKNFGYLGDGVADDIISMLARAPDVSVVARNSFFTYKGKATDVRQIGKELGVSYVLEGSVRKEADKIRIIAQLIDTRSDEHVWAQRYDKATTDPWALQDEVTGQIIATLAGETGQLKKAQYREAWGKDTTSLGEYDYYLRGHDIFLSAVDKAQADRAGEIWREGLAKYPDSDLLKISLGWYHYIAPFSFWSDDPAADYRAAGKLTREVLAHDNLSPLVRKLAHWLMAFVLAQERNFEGARKEATGAAELAPYDAQMLDHLAVVKLMVGEVDEALEWLDSADARDPSLAEISNYRRGWAYTLQNRNEQAVAALKQGVDAVDTPLLLAINYVRLGHLDEAKSSVQVALKIDPTFTQARWRVGYFYSDPSIVEREVADLAKAGLLEK